MQPSNEPSVIRKQLEGTELMLQCSEARNSLNVDNGYKILGRLKYALCICREFNRAWEAYKVFPSLANERLFSEAQKELEQLEKSVDQFLASIKPTGGS